VENFKGIKKLDSVALVELDPDRAFADAGDTVGKEFITLAAFSFLHKEILISQKVFGFANCTLGIG
jgi:hypothetical protein